MNNRFVDWRNTYVPGESVTTLEGMLSDAAKQSWDMAFGICEGTIQSALTCAVVRSKLVPKLEKLSSQRDEFVLAYQPPTTGCAADPEKQTEHAMYTAWNEVLKRSVDSMKEFLRLDRPLEKATNEISALWYGEGGCGSCGSKGGCGSTKNEKELVVVA